MHYDDIVSMNKHSMPWVEVISTFRNTPEEIVAMIKSGIKLTLSGTPKHDIIVCCTAKGLYCEAVYISSDDLILSNDRYTFANNTVTLETAQINYYEDTALYRSGHSQSDTIRYFVHPDSWRTTGTVAVRSTREIASAVIMGYARQLDKLHAITRRERQGFIAVMDKLSVNTISDEVMGIVGCSREEALKHVEECLSTMQDRITRNEADWIMQQLIENDSEYAQLMRDNIEKQWREEHVATLRQATDEIKKAESNLAAIKKDISAASAQLSALVTQKEQCEADVNEAIKLRDDVEKQIKERLLSIREERAKALVDEMWALSAYASNTPVQSSKNDTFSIEYDDNASEIEEVTLNDRMADAISTWSRICGKETRGYELAAFFFAAHAVDQHLIITGETADIIADTIAELITGRRCAKVHMSADASTNEVIRELSSVPHDYICFPNGLEQDYHAITTIIRHFAGSRFIITCAHAESLTMEPASLFTTFLPVYSEEFFVNGRIQEHDAGSCKVDLVKRAGGDPTGKLLRPYKSKQTGWFSKGFFAPLLVDRCARLYYAIENITKTWSDRESRVKSAMLYQVYAPLMKSMHRKDVLYDNLAAFEILEPTQMDRLMAFVGIEKE